MAQEKTQAFELRFEDGLVAKGEMNSVADLKEIRFLLPHLNPGARMHYSDSMEGRTSCTVIGDATVVRIENDPEQNPDEPLRVRLILKLVERNFTTLPDVGKVITLLPNDNSATIAAECIESDNEKATFCVTFEMSQISSGKTAVICTEDGDQNRFKIDSARLACLNSGINTSECVLSVSDMIAFEKDQIAKATSEQVVGNASKVPIISIGDKTKSVLQMLVAALFLTNLMLLFAPADGCVGVSTGDSPKAATTIIESSLASSEVEPETEKLASVIVLGDVDSETIPMTSDNLRAFFFYPDATKMPGSITGEADSNSLGIFCENSAVYDVDEKSSDVSQCKIAVPNDAKPGVYPLTPEQSKAWFHQEDPGCFVEAVLPYYSSPEDIRNGLRINVESCEWRFDPSRKCFDFSKCTFTIPPFTAE